MSKKLVIVESPTKSRTLKKFLGNEYEIIASGGHVRDLPPERLAVQIENGFEPEYVAIKGKNKIIAELKKVVWPTRREAAYLTMMVLVVAGTIGVILGVVDFGFSELIDSIFLGQ